MRRLRGVGNLDSGFMPRPDKVKTSDKSFSGDDTSIIFRNSKEASSIYRFGL